MTGIRLLLRFSSSDIGKQVTLGRRDVSDAILVHMWAGVLKAGGCVPAGDVSRCAHGSLGVQEGRRPHRVR